MHTNDQSPVATMLTRLQQWVKLDEEDREAVLGLPYQLRGFLPTNYLVREGDRSEQCAVLLAGFAFRSKIVGDGGRQIAAIHMRGDFVDLHNSVLGIADHNVQALTPIRVAFIPRSAILDIADQRPKVARAMWHDTLVDGSTSREWIANIGRRNASARIAHLLCEFAQRLELAGLGEQCKYELPMTQEQLADCVGLPPVHVSRTLKVLVESGLISKTLRTVRIEDWERLAAAGDFNSTYLHLDIEGRSIDPLVPPRALI